jgi:hypothetical protein
MVYDTCVVEGIATEVEAEVVQEGDTDSKPSKIYKLTRLHAPRQLSDTLRGNRAQEKGQASSKDSTQGHPRSSRSSDLHKLC